MGKRYPNSGILVLLSLGSKNCCTEKILFLHSKVAPDYEKPDSVTTLVSHKQLYSADGKVVYETCLVGHEDVIDRLFDLCLTDGRLNYPDKSLKLSLPQNISSEETTDDSYCRAIVYKTATAGHIPEFMQDKGLHELLTGHRADGSVTAILPLGLYERGWLFSKISAGYFAVKELRCEYIRFRGNGKTSDSRGCTGLTGFLQSAHRSHGRICHLLDREDMTELGQSVIDADTGLFSLKSSRAFKDGILTFDNACTAQQINFSLLMGFDINVNLSTGKVRDLFDRDLWVGQMQKRPAHFEDATWFEASFRNPGEAAGRLSDIFVNILSPLGRNIIIVDPYFLGTLKQTDEGSFELTNTQLALLNALVTIAVRYGLDSVTVIGNSRMKNHGEKASDDQSSMDVLMDKYENFWSRFFTGKLFSKIKPWRMIFRRAQTDFHNRYWFGATDDGNISEAVGAIVSNSLSGMTEVDFCNITPKHHFTMVTARYADIINNSKLLREI